MKNIKACLTATTDDWKTPTKIYRKFIEKGYIDCFKYKSKENELEKNYYDQKLFINPPFSKMKEITEWIIEQSKNNIIALLIPSRTDTKYFHKLLKLKPQIHFIKGRLHYNDSKSAPFPTILLIFYKINWLSLYAEIDQENIGKVIP